jgi:hypothetical protein
VPIEDCCHLIWLFPTFGTTLIASVRMPLAAGLVTDNTTQE